MCRIKARVQVEITHLLPAKSISHPSQVWSNLHVCVCVCVCVCLCVCVFVCVCVCVCVCVTQIACSLCALASFLSVCNLLNTARVRTLFITACVHSAHYDKLYDKNTKQFLVAAYEHSAHYE